MNGPPRLRDAASPTGRLLEAAGRVVPASAAEEAARWRRLAERAQPRRKTRAWVGLAMFASAAALAAFVVGAGRLRPGPTSAGEGGRAARAEVAVPVLAPVVAVGSPPKAVPPLPVQKLVRAPSEPARRQAHPRHAVARANEASVTGQTIDAAPARAVQAPSAADEPPSDDGEEAPPALGSAPLGLASSAAATGASPLPLLPTPSTPPPPAMRGRLPPWAWALIGGGAALVVGVGVGVGVGRHDQGPALTGIQPR